MSDNVMDTHYANDAEPSTALKSRASEWPSPGFPQPNVLGSEMHLPALATQCLREIDHYRQGKPCTDRYSVELLRRATVDEDQEAWVWVQHCFGGLVGGWLHRHPKREAACRLQSEETYVALAFERFWRANTSNKRLEFNRLAAVLQYLRASLHGCSSTAAWVPGRLYNCAHRSGVPSMKSLACGASSWGDSCATRITCDGASASSVQAEMSDGYTHNAYSIFTRVLAYQEVKSEYTSG